MGNSKDVSFQKLVLVAETIGWDTLMGNLEKIVWQNENLQADLFAGTPSQVKQAQKLAKTIIQQNNTITRLKQYKTDNGLDGLKKSE
jgi:hypothetical protein